MDKPGFIKFLKKAKRSESAIKRCVAYTQEFEQYLREHKRGKTLEQATPTDLQDFVRRGETASQSMKTHLWALRYYYQFTSDELMRDVAGELRAQRIERKPLALKEFRGVDLDHVDKLSSIGITNVQEMLEKGRTARGRKTLAEKTGVPVEAILELVKLSDLARIPGLKGIRARLYYDAGLETLEKLAQWDPEELREMLIAYVEQTGFDGVAPWPKEAKSAVECAQKLPRIVDYDENNPTPCKPKKVRIIITGGTFDKRYDELKGQLTFKETHLPAILNMVRCTVPFSLEISRLIDSLDMQDADRKSILAACEQAAEEHILITHGTDTMVDTARLLGKAGLNKTIVLTGAMIPYTVTNSDAVYNLGFGMCAVQLLPPDVYIAMNGQVFCWDDVQKNYETGVFERIQ